MMLKLLVVDDAPFIREIVKQAVVGSAIELVGEASDGEEAVAMALAKKPDVILMDMIMPRKNGIEATKEILKNNPHAKILAFSTVDQESMVQKAMDAGCCGYLSKPFTADDLLKAINKSGGQNG
jgi:two-component system, chemotaxis family, chemotaxis protein CheY